ncbi:MAG: ribonuclease HIII [Planctomycetes bacterium]|nr:ribonuclease HIII [Planctomycetota bacterium]
MTQRTLVVKVPASRGAELERKLIAQRFEMRSAPYALYWARGEGVVVTHYESGKFVVQGEHPEHFLEQFLGLQAGGDAPAGTRGKPAPRGDASAPQGAEVTTIGGDESGKGDYFGPLVVAAVKLTPELSRKLENGEVRDCKLMNDESVLRVGAALRANVPHAIARLDPPAYNAEHARVKNLNPMLAALHAKAVRELAEPGVRVVIDQFANESLLRKALAGADIQLEQRHRGEEELAVAAASVIAREQFLVALHELSEEFAIDLAKGAGSPVDSAARRFVALHGVDKLGAVAKLHFKNTQKLGNTRR